jgi:hypothetical protein
MPNSCLELTVFLGLPEFQVFQKLRKTDRLTLISEVLQFIADHFLKRINARAERTHKRNNQFRPRICPISHSDSRVRKWFSRAGEPLLLHQ